MRTTICYYILCLGLFISCAHKSGHGVSIPAGIKSDTNNEEVSTIHETLLDVSSLALIKDNRVALAQRIITIRGKREIVDNAFLKYYFQSN